MSRQKNALPDLKSLDPDWAFQFTGLFFAEGSATLQRTYAGTVYPVLTLKLRIDDAPLIEEIAQKLGGTVRVEKRKGRHDMIGWESAGVHHAQALCEIILYNAIIPAKKIKDVEHVLQFCTWRLSQPFGSVDRTEAERKRDELRELRKYKSTN